MIQLERPLIISSEDAYADKTEMQPAADALVSQYLGKVAAEDHEQFEGEHTSHTFEGLNFNKEEIIRAIEIVDRARSAPGVHKSNRWLREKKYQEALDHERRVGIFAVATVLRDAEQHNKDLAAALEIAESVAIAGLIHDSAKGHPEIYDVMTMTGQWELKHRIIAEKHPLLGAENALDSGVLDPIAIDLTATHHLDLKVNEQRNARPYGLELDSRNTWLRQVFSACDAIDARRNPRVYTGNMLPPQEAVRQLPMEHNLADDVYQLFDSLVGHPEAA